MRETGPAIIALSGVPADRTAAIALALEARSPETRRVYKIAIGHWPAGH